MRTAYIGHSYHQKTASTKFMIDFLRDHSTEMKFYLDESWTGKDGVDLNQVLAWDPDVIYVFQMEFLARGLVMRNPRARVIFIPMFDGAKELGPGFWTPFAENPNAFVVNFSTTLHTRLLNWGVKSFRFMYYPDPAPFPHVRDFSELNGFFWQRVPTPSWNTVKQLSEKAVFNRFHLHLAGDPTHTNFLVHPTAAETKRFKIRITDWFEEMEDYKKALFGSNVFFAPRPFEGIGMSFLEAMGAGMCVVAPDNPTMNEYITHGVNGLLYDTANPKPLDFSEAARLGANARTSVEQGYQVWKRDFEERMHELTFGPVEPESLQYQEAAWWHWEKAFKTPLPPRLFEPVSDLPKVTVAVVSFNAEKEIGLTLQTAARQTYPNTEIVVVDGASRDGTMDVVREFDSRLDKVVSEPDDGPFDAMTKAARIGTGDYVIYMNAGDYFYSPEALEQAITNGLANHRMRHKDDSLPDFITGDHMYLFESGASAIHKAQDFEKTWKELQEGALHPHWFGGVPCHQATLTRRSLVAELGYHREYSIAADHQFMFARRAEGKVFAHSNSLVAIYVGGGLSWQKASLCQHESWRIANQFTPNKKLVDHFYVKHYGAQVRIQDRDALEADIADIRDSGVFWEDWYRVEYMDVGDSNTDPILHYLLEGRDRGNRPSPFFDPEHYRIRNFDVYEAGADPLLHYVRFGKAQDRPARDWSDPEDPLTFFNRLQGEGPNEIAGISKRIADKFESDLLHPLKTLP